MKLDQIYTPYQTTPVYKVIINDYRDIDDNLRYKLIFIGPVKDIDVRNSLLKIENNQELSKEHGLEAR